MIERLSYGKQEIQIVTRFRLMLGSDVQVELTSIEEVLELGNGGKQAITQSD